MQNFICGINQNEMTSKLYWTVIRIVCVVYAMGKVIFNDGVLFFFLSFLFLFSPHVLCMCLCLCILSKCVCVGINEHLLVVCFCLSLYLATPNSQRIHSDRILFHFTKDLLVLICKRKIEGKREVLSVKTTTPM